MSWTVPLALYGWIGCVAILFATLAPARAALAAYLIGWLLLPVAELELFDVFDYGKSTAVPGVVFLAVVAFDGARLMRLRLGWLDLPIALVCAAPLCSSLSNGIGWYDGLSSSTYQVIVWGLPYLTGRLYFSTPDGMRLLGMGVLAGGLAYAPLCWWEIRMSPQLHTDVYGFLQHDWTQTLRSGGYRPMVFQHHGLMLGLWMSAASLVAVALWTSGTTRRVWGVPHVFVAALLCATTALCKSFGALALLLIGAATLWSMRALRSSLPMLLLACLPASYVLLRVSGNWSGDALTSAVAEVSSARAHSLAYRFDAEEQLRDKAEQKPLLGWGGWGRSFVRRQADPDSREMVVTDSLWILFFGKYGSLGLAAMLLTFLVPVLALWRRHPPRTWWRPQAFWPWVLALVLTLYAIDNLVNAMLNPIYLLIAGGLCGFASVRVAAVSRARSFGSIPPPPRLDARVELR
ncbi:MAG: O-antigen ligase domain-containing protein [Planctomycetota bacterium]|nr:MAG: O-antigen ligase domain-containing protein [Planctomycetota bacterium]